MVLPSPFPLVRLSRLSVQHAVCILFLTGSVADDLILLVVHTGRDFRTNSFASVIAQKICVSLMSSMCPNDY